MLKSEVRAAGLDSGIGFPAADVPGIRFNLAGRLPGTPKAPADCIAPDVSEARGRQSDSGTTRSLSFRRMAAGDDLEPLLDLVETGHKESRFGYIPFSRDKARKIGGRALADQTRNLLIVGELRGRPVGFLFASVGEFHIGTDVKLATIHAVYTEAECRASLLGGRTALGLFGAVERWSVGAGATEVMLHITSGISSSIGSVASRLDFTPVGASYVARLDPFAHVGDR